LHATVRLEKKEQVMAGWGDDPVLEELRAHVYSEGWKPVSIAESRESDTVTVERDGERKEFTSDHIAFHRFVEGLKEDFGL
jgi:hypothetical protein